MKWSRAAALSSSRVRVEHVEDAGDCRICEAMVGCDVVVRI